MCTIVVNVDYGADILSSTELDNDDVSGGEWDLFPTVSTYLGIDEGDGPLC